MNLDKLAPDNNGAGKMDQSKVILSLLFKTNEQLAETVEKRMSDFNYPASGFEVRITFHFFALLTSGTNVGSVLVNLNRLGAACIAGTQAKILRMRLTDCRTGNDNFIQRFFQKLDIMRVCT